MAEGLNKAYLGGNLGADPELRVTQGGHSVLNLRLACSETYLDRNRVRQERTEWVTVVVWGKRADALAKILSKGSRVFVEGKIETQTYDDREGIKRYRTQVVASQIFLGGKARSAPTGDEDRPRQNRRDYDSGSSDAPAGGGGGGGYDDQDYGTAGGGGDDDIPFVRSASGAPESWWPWARKDRACRQ